MQAIEFETTAHNHLIRIPDTAPDGVPLRVLLLVDDMTTEQPEPDNEWRTLLASMPDVGEDEDFSRTKDYGRELSWDT